jgi:hypothetical protein
LRQTGEPNAWVIAASGAAFALLFLAGIFAMQAYFLQAERAENARKVVAVAPEELSLARAQQTGQIAAYRWVDRNAGVVAIPIDVAMDLVVKEGLKAPPAASAAPASVADPAKARAKKSR